MTGFSSNRFSLGRFFVDVDVAATVDPFEVECIRSCMDWWQICFPDFYVCLNLA